MKFIPTIQPCTAEGDFPHKSGYIVTYLNDEGGLSYKFFSSKEIAERWIAQGGGRLNDVNTNRRASSNDP